MHFNRRKEDRCRTGERLYPESSLTELDERKNIIYLPGRMHSCSVGGCNSLSSTSSTKTTAPCLCSPHPHPYNATADCCCPSQQQPRFRNPLQPSQHCRAVEALLINCSSNPADDHSGLSYQQIQMTPVASRKAQASSNIPQFTIDDPQQTVFVTFKPMVSCVSGSASDDGSQSVDRKDLDLVRDSFSKDRLSMSSAHDGAINDNQIVTS